MRARSGNGKNGIFAFNAHPAIMSRMKTICAVLALFTLLGAVSHADDSKTDKPKSTMPAIPEGAEAITLGAGCFCCTEAIFQQIPGVLSVTSGYMGGTAKNPTYEQVCTGTTGHAEVSRIVYDPKQTTLEKVLAVFWEAHDPTALNRQ